MVIRSLENLNCTLSVIQDQQGDVYVTIVRRGQNPKEYTELSVRIGGPGSGQCIPPALMRTLHQLANEFERYRDCKNESDAYWKINERERTLATDKNKQF